MKKMIFYQNNPKQTHLLFGLYKKSYFCEAKLLKMVWNDYLYYIIFDIYGQFDKNIILCILYKKLFWNNVKKKNFYFFPSKRL